MPIRPQEIRKFVALSIVFLLVVLSFLVLKPILLSIITGLILGFIFYPLYKRIFKVFKEKNTSALAVSAILIIIVFIPFWFLVPLAIQQVFSMFSFLQGVDVAGFVDKIVPNFSDKTQIDVTTAIISFIGKISSGSLSALANLLLDLPSLLLNLSVIIFVFFFTLRDGDKLRNYVSELSPFKKEKEKVLTKKFKDITFSIIFGHIIVGIIQGIATGIGLFIAGVPRALLLTIFAILASIIPILGPWLVWVPAAVYLFTSGQMIAGIFFTLWGLLVVSTIDNFLRPYIVAKRTKSSSVIVLVGMIGGLFVFGVLGLILGPLILAYLILFLDAYKDRTLASMFASE